MDAEANQPQPERLVVNFYKGPHLPADFIGVIMSKWLRSHRKLNPVFKKIDEDSYFRHYDPYLRSILYRPNVVIRLLVLENDHDVVFGWSVSEKHTLHYIYIQEPYRGHGYAKDLFPKDIEWISHWTLHWEKRLNKKQRNRKIKFNPFLYGDIYG